MNGAADAGARSGSRYLHDDPRCSIKCSGRPRDCIGLGMMICKVRILGWGDDRGQQGSAELPHCSHETGMRISALHKAMA